MFLHFSSSFVCFSHTNVNYWGGSSPPPPPRRPASDGLESIRFHFLQFPPNTAFIASFGLDLADLSPGHEPRDRPEDGLLDFLDFTMANFIKVCVDVIYVSIEFYLQLTNIPMRIDLFRKFSSLIQLFISNLSVNRIEFSKILK